MNKLLFGYLLKWPKPYITGLDLNCVLSGSIDSKKSNIKRAVQEKELIRLKKDLYLIRRSLETSSLDLFEVSSLLYGPSYISLESALSCHDWIPERVSQVTCATSKRRAEFDTELGSFTFEHIPPEVFSLGITSQKGSSSYLIAHPWKALADYIYVRNKTWNDWQELYTDLRIEKEYLLESDFTLLDYLITNYPSNRVKSTLLKIKGSIKSV